MGVNMAQWMISKYTQKLYDTVLSFHNEAGQVNKLAKPAVLSAQIKKYKAYLVSQIKSRLIPSKKSSRY